MESKDIAKLVFLQSVIPHLIIISHLPLSASLNLRNLQGCHLLARESSCHDASSTWASKYRSEFHCGCGQGVSHSSTLGT